MVNCDIMQYIKMEMPFFTSIAKTVIEKVARKRILINPIASKRARKQTGCFVKM